jgi:four helix bundle protein
MRAAFEDGKNHVRNSRAARKSLISRRKRRGTAIVGACDMPPKRMSERTSELQCAVIDEYRRVRPADHAEHELWTDLLKTVRALANNGGESGGTQSRTDFIQKFHICLKEAKECLQLLTALMHACPDRAIELRRLWKACDEITAILVASLKTAKANEEREKRERRRSKFRS